MRKRNLFMAGCVLLLSLSMLFVGCNKEDKDDSKTNEYVVNGTSYAIIDALYEVGDIFTIGFVSQGTIEDPSQAFAFCFENVSTFPIGTFSWTELENDVAALIFNNDGYEELKSGTVTITKSGDYYTIEMNNGILNSNGSLVTFYYNGKIEEYVAPEPPTPNGNYFTLGDKEYNISLGGYFTTEEEGIVVTAIVLLDATYQNNLGLIFLSDKIQTGTFNFSETSFNFMGAITINEASYMMVDGTCTISYDGTNYTIDITGGNAVPDTGGNGFTATCHYEGSLLLLEEYAAGISNFLVSQFISRNIPKF